MIYTVTFNPSLDYIVGVDEFKTGKVKVEVLFKVPKSLNIL